MIDTILNALAPHHCCGCGKTGALLCENCKYDIDSDRFSRCVICAGDNEVIQGVCIHCRKVVQRAWLVGERDNVLRRLIDAYKFERVRSAHRVVAKLLDNTLPELPTNVIIVAIPTTSSHIRQRGYDHTALVARSLAKMRRLNYEPRLLIRQNNAVQRGKTRKQRFEQAENLFTCPQELNPDAIYLIIDDVVTTGATVSAVARILRKKGAAMVWVAAVAHQPLD